MIKINLLAEPSAAAAARRRRPQISLGARQGDVILLVTLAIAVLAVGGYWYYLSSERSERRQLESQLRVERDKLAEFIEKVEELEGKRDTLRDRIQIIEQLKRDQHGPVRILDEVSRALPDLVWLEQMKVEGTTVTLRGRALDENAIANYISNLRSSPFFQEPNVVDIIRAAQDTFNFTLTVVFTYAPPEIQAAEPAT